MIFQHNRLSGITFLAPENARERTWFSAHVVAEDWQRSGEGVAVDARCAAEIAEGARRAGFKVRK